MPNLPLLTPDYLASPTMFGSVSPLTAKIMASAGADLSKSIEDNAQKFEAQQKAPEIAQMMSSGLTLLASGKTEGFNYLANARAAGATNPFLANMTKDALNEGHTVYNSHISEANQQNRFRQTLSLAEIQDNRSRVRQAHTDERVDEKRVELDYAAWVKDEAARKEQAEMAGETFVANPEPTRPKRLGGPGAPSIPVEANAVTPGGLFGSDTGLPTPPMDNFTPGVGATTAPAATATPLSRAQIQAQTVLPSKDVVPPTATPAASPKLATPIPARNVIMENAVKNKNTPILVNEVLKQAGEAPLTPEENKKLAANFHQIPFGMSMWNVEKVPESKGTTRKSVTSSQGTFVQTTGEGDKKNTESSLVKEFVELAGSAGNLDPDFAMWASKEMSEGRQVTIGPNPNDPKGPWIAKNNKGVPMSDLNPQAGKEGQPAMKLHPVAKEMGKVWDRAQQILPLIKDKVHVDFTGTSQEVGKQSYEDIKGWQNAAIEGLASHKDPKIIFEKVNQKLEQKGVPPVSWEMVEAFKNSKLDPNKVQGRDKLSEMGIKVTDRDMEGTWAGIKRVASSVLKALGPQDDTPEFLRHSIDHLNHIIQRENSDPMGDKKYMLKVAAILADQEKKLADLEAKQNQP